MLFHIYSKLSLIHPSITFCDLLSSFFPKWKKKLRRMFVFSRQWKMLFWGLQEMRANLITQLLFRWWKSYFVINVVPNWGSKQWPYSLHGLRCVKWCIFPEKVREFCMGRICVTVGLEAMHKYDFEIRFWFNLIMTFSDVALNFFFFFWCGMLNSLLLSNWQQQKKNVVFFIFHFSIMCSD